MEDGVSIAKILNAPPVVEDEEADEVQEEETDEVQEEEEKNRIASRDKKLKFKESSQMEGQGNIVLSTIRGWDPENASKITEHIWIQHQGKK
ncbi:hypothetical protein RND71_017848 [Anisodus tanguticus]|uniref:Uncharacterized protein n=1 Tax=Anisodus tanguticus TaxID=243964 RepID=A0AAE1S3L8_9SOLA|nr:hypothetical protein RND71_017848 [Anisodus tanguticus]